MTENWDDVKIFLAVARSETLSRAAKVLGLDPATLGRRIARLEAACGTPLFAKSPQGYALTDGGQRLFVHAERVEQAMQAARDEVDGQTGGLSGQIRIGAPDGVANFLLPQVCARIAGDNPDLEIQILALPRVVNLTRREADMVIAVSAPTAGRLSVQKICPYQLHLAAAQDYIRSAPPLQTLADLQAHRVVGYIQDMIFDKELDYLGEAGLGRVDLASNSVAVQIRLLQQGAGVGVMHQFAMPAAADLRAVLTDQFSLTRNLFLVRHTDDRRLDRMNRFAEAIVRGVREEVRLLEGRA